MSKICVFPGTFDPFTLGHYDITQRAAKMFDEVIIAVNATGAKRTMFTQDQRVEFAKKALSNIPNVEVKALNGLLVDFCKQNNSTIVVRGIRTSTDLEYESVLNAVYKKQYPDIETVFFINAQEFSHIHGTIVRDLIQHNCDLDGFVPQEVIDCINELK